MIPESESFERAADAVTYIWEECKFGRLTAEDDGSFWKFVSEHLYKTRSSWRRGDLQLDAPNPNLEGHSDGYDGGWMGYQPPNQIVSCYLSEVRGGIELLPKKHASVMQLIANGSTALDICTELRIPVHTVFRLIAEARRYLFDRQLIAMAKDRRRAIAAE